MTNVVVEGLTVRSRDALLLNHASIRFGSGELVAILGPNGAGKTSLLRAMLGLVASCSGTAELDEQNIFSMTPAQRATKVSYLPQIRPLAWPINVRDAVSLGRFAHGGALGRLNKLDATAVNEAIASCDLTALKYRSTDSLSGGELARVHFARAIAAQTPLLIADEPVSALDPRHQLRIASLLRRYVEDGGGALVVLHEVGLAARFADRLVWMKNGKIVGQGTVDETLTEEVLANIYGVSARVKKDAHGFDVRIEDVL